MQVKITISEKEMKDLIINYLSDKLNHNFKPDRLRILVKSKQNYKSEWEVSDFKAEYEDN